MASNTSAASSAFAPLQNDTFLRACLRQATDHTPVWLMRQAGRYLPEYCATRAKAGSFMGLATNVDYATEVTLQPLDRYPLDASILFSDILTVPDAMGLGLSFAQGEGPRFAKNVRDEAGAQAAMIFDSWGGVLADGAFQQFSMAYTARVLRQLKTEHNGQRIPSIVFTKGGGLWLPEMAGLNCDVLGLDWTMNLGRARAMVGGEVGGPGKALQGNIDPNILFAPPAQIATEVHRVLDSFGTPHTDKTQTGPTHIFNLGHGISQYTPPEHVTALVEAVHSHSRKLRQG